MKAKSNYSTTDIFEKLPVSKALRAMAVPTIISQLIVLIYNIADTFYVGQVNNPDMVAGASLILPIFNISLALASLTGIGGGALVSRLLGKNQPDEAKRISIFSIYFAIIIAGLFSLTFGLFMPQFLDLLGADEFTFEFARQYSMCVIVAGAIPTVLSNVLANLIRSVGCSKEAGFGITLGGVLNMILDPIFMFLLLPKGYELLGVGVATFISNCVACSYFIIFIAKSKKQSIITFNPRHGLPEAKNVLSIFTVGIPSCLATLLFDIDYIVIDKLMTTYSNVALASIGIVLKVERLPLNVGIGLCQGMMPIIAYNFASGNRKRMTDTINYARGVGLVFAAISIALYELCAPFIMRIFIPDAATIALGTTFLRIRILATPLMFLSFFTVYLFQAVGEGRTALFLGVVRWAVFNIPMLYVLNYFIGMYGIVWSQVTADILTVAVSFAVYFRYMAKTRVEKL